jgi:hypothetical protein
MGNDISNYLISHEDESSSNFKDEDIAVGSNTFRQIKNELDMSDKMSARQ